MRMKASKMIPGACLYSLTTGVCGSIISRPFIQNPDSKVHWANMGPIWGPQDTDGPHVGP